MKYELSLPGNHHIPAAENVLRHAPQWATRLQAPDFQRIARHADALAYAAISTPEHFAMPHAEVPRLGAFWMDALSVMSFVAGATERIRVGVSVLVAPYHHPLRLAKALSTIDTLSGGRTDLSVGVGHARQEFAALGVEFTERGARTDETLDAMVELWTADDPRFVGEHFTIEGLAFAPRPVQSPRPPIYIGGNSRPALRRAARFDGWEPNPVGLRSADLAESLQYLHEQRDLLGRPHNLEVRWVSWLEGVGQPEFCSLSATARAAWAEQVRESVGVLTERGVTALVIPEARTASLAEYLEYLSWFDAEVIGAS